MPSRKDIFLNGKIYHIFNKTIDKRTVFSSKTLASLFINTLQYYRSSHSVIRYSHFKELPPRLKHLHSQKIYTPLSFRIEILSYCLMPNHFHLLVKQRLDDGIIKTVGTVLNSITRYFNVLHERKGPVFLPQFRSKRIITGEQLIHVSRYIHLNPYTSGVVKTVSELQTYPFSSLKEYQDKEILCNTRYVLDHFKGSKDLYIRFVLSNKKYQKTLESIKHRDKKK